MMNKRAQSRNLNARDAEYMAIVKKLQGREPPKFEATVHQMQQQGMEAQAHPSYM